MIHSNFLVTLFGRAAVGGGLLLWYFTPGSDSDKPDLGESQADNSPIVVAAPANTGQNQGQASITHHVANAFFKYAGSHAERIGKFRKDGNLDRYNWIVGGKHSTEDKNMREGELFLVGLIEQCKSVSDSKLSVPRFSSLGLDLTYTIDLHFQKMFSQSNPIPEGKLFECLFKEGDFPNKARYTRNLLNDPIHTKRVLNALDVYSKDLKKSAEEDSQLYCDLLKLFEYAKARLLSGHVPGKLCDKQLEWAIIDFEVKVENLDNFVKAHPEFQEQIFVKNISFKEDF